MITRSTTTFLRFFMERFKGGITIKLFFIVEENMMKEMLLKQQPGGRIYNEIHAKNHYNCVIS